MRAALRSIVAAALALLLCVQPALATVWDTLDTDSVSTAGVTFTNANLTAQISTSTHSVVQSLEGKKSGKWYVEFTVNTTSASLGVGLIPAWGVLSTFLGGTGSAGSPNGDAGWAYYNNTPSGLVENVGTAQTAVNLATYTTSDVIGMAVDLDNGRVWWRKNTGSWVGTSGTPNPATNTGGFDISNLLTGGCRVYIGFDASVSGTKLTLNAGGSAFTGAVPSGFTAGWTNTTAGTYFGTLATSSNLANNTLVNTPPQNDKAVSPYTATLTGSLTSIVIPFSGATVSDLKGVIYDATGVGGLPGALLGVSSNTIAAGAYGEKPFLFSGVGIVSGTKYWPGVVSDSVSSGTQNVTICPALTSGIAFNSGTYASPTNPFGASPSTANFRYPILAFVGSNISPRHRLLNQ